MVSIHGMGGNVGDAVAPFIAGTLLSGIAIGGFALNFGFTWRQVMIANVVPGFFMAVIIFWQLGKLSMGAKTKGGDTGLRFVEVLRGFGGGETCAAGDAGGESDRIVDRGQGALHVHQGEG